MMSLEKSLEIILAVIPVLPQPTSWSSKHPVTREDHVMIGLAVGTLDGDAMPWEDRGVLRLVCKSDLSSVICLMTTWPCTKSLLLSEVPPRYTRILTVLYSNVMKQGVDSIMSLQRLLAPHMLRIQRVLQMGY